MKIRFLPLAALALAAITSCAPVYEPPSLRPVLMKASATDANGPASAAPGQPVVLQGRHLGGAVNGTVIFRADDRGRSGVRSATADIVSWSTSEVVVRVPASATPGGGFVYVEVAGVLSNGLPFSVGQAAGQ